MGATFENRRLHGGNRVVDIIFYKQAATMLVKNLLLNEIDQ